MKSSIRRTGSRASTYGLGVWLSFEAIQAPFLNCTDCGPRFTIVRGVPYDRPLTTMAAFEMCSACRAEYHDPTDRRCHAQPTACPVCGPQAVLLDGGGEPAAAADAVADAAAALAGGSILAIKGIGGYHLACRADDEDAVARLRARKHREEKPFALMVSDLDAARGLVELTDAEEQLLLGRERPIVVARRRASAAVAPSVAPGAPDVGVMLPYVPLHHLLVADAGLPLVMTSGNVSDEPIAYEDADALHRLRGIADRFLVHDRPIHVRTDDSVVRSLGALRRAPLMLRRSRGYVPASIALPLEAQRPILACGAEQKSTFCLGKGRRAWVSHHVGDLENWETLRSWREGVEHFERLFAVSPEVVAHDLHPEYLSTKEAHEREAEGVELIGVQHHHAHLAAVLAEHGETGTAVGAIYDGTGYGTDGTVWGGEILVGDLAGFTRAASLVPVAMPGGARAIREPWRMACAWLLVAGAGEEPPPALAAAVDAERWEQIAALARSGLSSPTTSSMGRLFDAVAALVGLRGTVAYEGQAAVELEAIAGAEPAAGDAYALPLREPAARQRGATGERSEAGEEPSGGDAPSLLLDARETVLAVASDAAAGIDPSTISRRFHAAVAASTAEAVARCAEAAGTSSAVLAGGVFQNRRLLELTTTALEARGLRVLLPERLPPNDGAIAYRQAAVAAAGLAPGRQC